MRNNAKIAYVLHAAKIVFPPKIYDKILGGN
jgi:hypothetical protein